MIKISIMSQSEILIEYKGLIDLKAIEIILKELRNTREFKSLQRMTGKRVYALVVECLENICKNSLTISQTGKVAPSYISVTANKDSITIVARNLITEASKENLVNRLEQVNSMDEAALKDLYEHKINSDYAKDKNGAGLGFIFMALKSRNKIIYSFKPQEKGYLFFELVISINKHIMRKLIIEKTSSSPQVILDPESKIYMISGESRPQDVRAFYDQILSWLKEFSMFLHNSGYDGEEIVFKFNFEYFNSSSGKMILDICKVLAGLRSKGINIIVRWVHETEDGDMLEAGKEISRIVKFPFEYLQS